VLKGYSPSTIKTYTGEFMSFLQIIKGVPATEFSPERLKDYLYYCATELKLSESTLHSKINALKFYYEQVLGREKFFWDVPRPKKKQQNPAMFNQDEIAAIIKGTENIKHKAMLMVAYSSGLRVSEVVALKPSNIDSKRMCLHIEQGKGKKDRMVSLSPVLLVMLREYWQQWKPKPKVYLFEGQEAGIQYSTRSLQEVLQQAKDRASIKKKGSIHALRHSFATHLLDKGADVSMIMKLLGHNDVRTTMRYLHVTNRDLLQIVSPLDSLNL
jgi:site-specific recombinase XerD